MIERRVLERSSIVMCSVIALAAVGCASQTPTPRDARAAGEWTFRLPETRSPYASLAIAHGTGDPGALAMVDDALGETPVAKADPAKPRVKRTVVAQTEPKADAAAAAKSAPQPVAAMATPVQAQPLALHVPPTAPSDEQRYLQREQQSQKQRDFRGGDAIVISASALVIILLVVILILVLT